MNKTLLTGNLTQAARFNAVNDETDAVSFSVATNDGYMGADDQWVDVVEYHECTRFVKKGNGETLAAKLTKGRAVEIEGQLRKQQPREKDGVTYHNWFIRVSELKLGKAAAVKDDAQESA